MTVSSDARTPSASVHALCGSTPPGAGRPVFRPATLPRPKPQVRPQHDGPTPEYTKRLVPLIRRENRITRRFSMLEVHQLLHEEAQRLRKLGNRMTRRVTRWTRRLMADQARDHRELALKADVAIGLATAGWSNGGVGDELALSVCHDTAALGIEGVCRDPRSGPHGAAVANSLAARYGADAAVIDLAERVKALAERHDRVYNRMLDVLARTERWEFANRPRRPEPLPSEMIVVWSKTDTHEVTHVEQPLRALAEQKAQREAFEAASAAHKAAVERKRAGTREPYLDKLQARMWWRLECWTRELVQTEPRTQAGIAAKAAASLAVNKATEDLSWAKDLADSVSRDALRIISAGADARYREDQGRDGELLALGRAWQDCTDRLDQASVLHDGAEERLARAAVPEPLFANPETDPPVLAADSRLHVSTGRRWYGEHATIGGLRRPWDYGDLGLARRNEILATYDACVARKKADEEAVGLPAASDALERVVEENIAFRRRILAIPAHTLEGLLLRLRVANWCCGDVAAMEVDLQQFVCDGHAHNEAFALAVVLDASRLLAGRIARPVPPLEDIRPVAVPVGLMAGHYPAGLSGEVVESYRTFLQMELRFLNAEVYGRNEAGLHYWQNNPAGRFHNGEHAPATSRAAAVLSLLGLMPDRASEEFAEAETAREARVA